MGLSGSCACSCAVNNEMKRLGLAMLVLAVDELVELDVAVAAGVAADSRPVTCMFFPPGYEFETSCENAQPGIGIARTQ